MAQDPGGLNDGNGDSEYYNDANNLNPAYMGGGVPSENEGDPQDFKGRMIHPASLAPTQPAPPPEASTAAAPSNDLHPGSMTLAPQDYSLSTEPTQAPAPASPLHPTSPTPAGYDENLNAITKDRKFTQPAEGGPTPVPMPKTYDPDQINSARLAAYKTQGVKHYKDPASGLIVPETNDDGTVRFAAKTGPVQYDAQGQAIQTAQDDHGNRSQVYPDANAPIGPHPDRPGEIYKQNKLSAWQYLGTADEMANSTDPAKQQAAADAQKMIDGHLIKSASEGFKALTGQISKEQNNATAAYQTATKQVNDLDTQVSAIKANPVTIMANPVTTMANQVTTMANQVTTMTTHPTLRSTN